MARVSRLALLVSFALVLGAARPSQQRKPSAAAEALAQSDSFSGLLVPLNATDLYAPESGFRISGWSSWGGPLKLKELAKDGAEVKQGQVIAQFEFDARDAMQWINERVQRARADENQARISGEQALEALRVEERRLHLEAELAAIDLQRERAISRRQADLYRISHKIAQFEAEAVTQRLASATRSRAAELAFQQESVARAERDLTRFKFYEGRYRLVAAADGVVRHAFNPRERRKVQKGDQVFPGMKLVSVARDSALAVRFFVPEHRLFELKVGAEVTAVSPASGDELKAIVKRVDFFPQELGFLMELPTLPNAREKAFAVVAELVDPPAGLSAGTELRVKAKASGGGR